MDRRPTNTNENYPAASTPRTKRVRMAPREPPTVMTIHPSLAEAANEESWSREGDRRGPGFFGVPRLRERMNTSGSGNNETTHSQAS